MNTSNLSFDEIPHNTTKQSSFGNTLGIKKNKYSGKYFIKSENFITQDLLFLLIIIAVIFYKTRGKTRFVLIASIVLIFLLLNCEHIFGPVKYIEGFKEGADDSEDEDEENDIEDEDEEDEEDEDEEDEEEIVV